jgi:hypothetical protein
MSVKISVVRLRKNINYLSETGKKKKKQGSPVAFFMPALSRVPAAIY